MDVSYHATEGEILFLYRVGALGSLCALLALFQFTATSSAESTPATDRLSAAEIMQRVSDRDNGDNHVSDVIMILIDKSGNERIRKMRNFGKDFGEDNYALLFFLAPANVRDTGLLTYDYDDDDADDDQWLYLPALKKSKRIAAADKSAAFMGSDFNYSDMTSRSIDRYTYTLVNETEVDGHEVWQIESVPKTDDEIDETGYTKFIYFVRQDNFVVVRSIGWLKRGNLLRQMVVHDLAQIDGIWVPLEVSMTTKKGQKTLHKTVLRTSNVKFNQELDPADFTIRRLEKGI